VAARKALITGLALVALTCTFLAGVQGVRAFKPPRTAVVSIGEVFEGYQKKKDRQAQFQARIKEVDEKLKDLEKKYKDLEAEIRNLEEGEKKDLKERDLLGVKQEAEKLKKVGLSSLKETQLKFLKELKEEIKLELDQFAEAMDIDILLEKRVTAEAAEGGFEWPIVHYAKPELDVTKEIIGRLNSRYRPENARATTPK
jgi:Skp family chaperone for outer membrane proteins